MLGEVVHSGGKTRALFFSREVKYRLLRTSLNRATDGGIGDPLCWYHHDLADSSKYWSGRSSGGTH